MSASDVIAAKTSLRRELLARRSRQTDADRARTAATLAQVFAAEFESRIRGGDPVEPAGDSVDVYRPPGAANVRALTPLRVVALYLSFATEPGTGPLIQWLADQRVRPGQTVLAVVHDDEVLDAVPNESHDRIVDGALTPSGVRYFGIATDG